MSDSWVMSKLTSLGLCSVHNLQFTHHFRKILYFKNKITYLVSGRHYLSKRSIYFAPYSSNFEFPILTSQQLLDKYHTYSMALTTICYGITSLNIMPQYLKKMSHTVEVNITYWIPI
jgi:hypothetical protein